MDDETKWTIYFAQITGINYHPKNGTPAEHHNRLQYCMKIADLMLAKTKERWPCPSPPPQS